MRELLFRAKAINREKGEHRTNYNNGDWVYGLISKPYNDCYPYLPAEMRNEEGVNWIEVDYKTICQYIGMTDRNGEKIFAFMQKQMIVLKKNGAIRNCEIGVMKYLESEVEE